MKTKCNHCNSDVGINFHWSDGTERDLKNILQFLGNLPKAGVKEYLESFLLATSNGEIIGCMGFEIHLVPGARNALLRSLKVKRGFRRKGIATKLFNEILDALKKQGIDAVIGFTLTNKMKNMVQKFGAKKISKREARRHISRQQPSELFDNKLSAKCQAWLFPIPK